MDKYKVGDRVKIKDFESPEYIGAKGEIKDIKYWRDKSYLVVLDTPVLDLHIQTHICKICVSENCLEKIYSVGSVKVTIGMTDEEHEKCRTYRNKNMCGEYCEMLQDGKCSSGIETIIKEKLNE